MICKCALYLSLVCILSVLILRVDQLLEANLSDIDCNVKGCFLMFQLSNSKIIFMLMNQSFKLISSRPFI